MRRACGVIAVVVALLPLPLVAQEAEPVPAETLLETPPETLSETPP